MTTRTANQQTKDMTNGVDVSQIMNVIGAIEADTDYAKFQSRVSNRWIEGGFNRSRIKDSFAGNEENKTREQAFLLDADEAAIAEGQDSAPTPVEYVLHALAIA
jgi:hypothetical protein